MMRQGDMRYGAYSAPSGLSVGLPVSRRSTTTIQESGRIPLTGIPDPFQITVGLRLVPWQPSDAVAGDASRAAPVIGRQIPNPIRHVAGVMNGRHSPNFGRLE